MILLFLFLIIRVSDAVDLFNNSVTLSSTQRNLGNEGHRDDTQEEGVVETDYGFVRGVKRESGIWEYLDVPYGAFDVENPFQEAGPPEKWDIHQKTQHQSHCPQILENGEYSASEQCLTLSIFTPPTPNNYDVLFHIHDGSFVSGSGDPRVYGPDYLVPEGIILILPNYRLGPLGFLCSQNDIAPGNAGLKDLTLALAWTKNNIDNFGGNASSIVVSGSGASAALVEYLMLSEKSKRFINRAITESGSILSHWAFDRQPLETIARLEDNLNKSETGRNNFADAPLENLLVASKGIHFRPCIENGTSGFITETPARMLRNSNVQIPYMSGIVNHAGMAKALEHNEETIAKLNNNYALLLPDDLEFENNEIKTEIGRQVKEHYFCNDDITLDNIERLSLCYTDFSFLSPSIRTARSLVEVGVSVFYYEFSFVSLKDLPRKCTLGETLNYVFSKEERFEVDSDEEKIMNAMTSLWISFIKTGQPVLDGIEWKQLKTEATAEEETWLSIGHEIKPKQGLHQDRMELWDEIYRKYYIDRNASYQVKPTLIISTFIVLIMDISKNLITLH